GSFERKPAAPRRVRNGVRLQGAETQTWVGQRWSELLEQLVPPKERLDGVDYARRGQTVSMEIVPGCIDARVQGRAARPYTTRWRIPVFEEGQWQRLIDAMAAEALYAAKLLARELPEAVDALPGLGDLRLLPQPPEVQLECDCGRGGVCKHAAAVGYLAAERLDGEPVKAFELRGMAIARLLERLAAVRARKTRSVAAHAEPLMPYAAEQASRPLESCLDSFWRPGPQLAELQRMPPPQHAPHALLRRLGPSPLPGRFPLVGLLASVYDTVAQEAIRLRDRAEGLDEASGGRSGADD
ncbi:MAG: SWIM zinc finger family protein, partial [Planctomycetota bacterium]